MQLQKTVQRVTPRLGACLAICGLVAIVVAVTGFDNRTPMPGVWALLPTVGAALFIAFASPQNLAGRLLGTRVPVAIGLISYSVYLWHFPVFALSRIRFDYPSGDPWIGASLILLVLVLSWFSYRWVEQPCRRSRVSRLRVFALVIICVALMLLLALVGIKSQGFSARLDDEQAARLAQVKSAVDETEFDNQACIFNMQDISDVFVQRFERCHKLHGPAVLVLGDSHATDFFNAIGRSVTGGFIVGVTQPSCRIQYFKPECQYGRFMTFVVSNADKVRSVFYVQTGRQFLKKEKKLPVNTEDIAKTLVYLHELSRHVRLIWAGPHVEPNVDIRNMNILFRHVSNLDEREENKLIYMVDKTLMKESSKMKIQYLSLISVIKYEFSKDFFVDGKYTYSDENHWSTWGEIYFGKLLVADPVVASMLGIHLQGGMVRQ